MSPSDRTMLDRVYARLLRAYPEPFRARFAEAMRASVSADYARARGRGALLVARFWARTIADAIGGGLAERLSRSQRGPAGPRWTIDWRDACRALHAAPVVTLMAVASLALGVGANTALFSILDSLVFKSLPVQNPDRLFVIDGGPWTNPIWEDVRGRHLFAGDAAWAPARFNLSDRGETDFISGAFVSGGMFDLLGVPAVLGRTLTAADDTRAAGVGHPAAVISYGFWQRRFGGATDVLGRSLLINSLDVPIVGVTPRGFLGLDVGQEADVFVPIAVSAAMPGRERSLDNRLQWWLEIVGRLRAHETMAQAGGALNAARPLIRLATLPERSAGQNSGYLSEPFQLAAASSGVSDLRETYVGPLGIMLLLVGGVLAVACANIANLLLARATARRPELTLRLALGASRGRVARQLLAESAVVSAAGAALGLLLARLAAALLVRQVGAAGAVLDLAPDWRVFGFTALVAILTTLLFGAAPAVSVARLAPGDVLKEHGRGLIGDRRLGLRQALVVGQIALSLVLVLGGALFVRTFRSLVTSPVGFDADRLIVVDINASRLPAPVARLDQAAADVSALPGVMSAVFSAITPAGGGGWNTRIDARPGQPKLTGRNQVSWVNAVTPGFFRAYGTRLLEGRDFDRSDVAGAPLVAIVNRRFADRFLPGQRIEDAIVQTAADTSTPVEYRVVGLVDNTVYRSPRTGFEPVLYLPRDQTTFAGTSELSVRVAPREAAAIMPSVVRTLSQSVPEAVFTPRLMTDQLGARVRQERLVAWLAGLFGVVSLFLAALGLYGVTAYSASCRRAEVGIRLALGSTRAAIVRLLVGRVVALAVAGVAIGALLGLWLSRFIATMLFHVTARDPVTLAASAAVLLVTATVAAWLPGRRAASADPAGIIRSE